VALLEMLNILERFPMRLGMEGSSRSGHLLIEAMRRASFDRRRHLADPAFFPVPVQRLTGKAYGASLAAGISRRHATPSRKLGPQSASDDGEESASTTHFSIVDAAGNVISNTYTLNGFYGSQVIARGTGVLLNDIMSAFSGRPGERNSIGPSRRPVSSMGPVILLRPKGTPWCALGSPGAATIASTLLQMVVNLVDYRMSLRDAIEYPRIHHQYLPDRVEAEPGALVFDVAQRLKAMGHRIDPKLRSQGDVHAVMIEEGTGWRLGWSDGRRGGRALGY
jgi:gamma-glutamyltranspeptidase/glutathione hydrolase